MTQVTCFLLVLPIISFGQKSYDSYLQKNRQDLRLNNNIKLEKETRIIGYGAIHGSSKTEDAEIFLLKYLVNNNLKFYFPETDLATALYFQKYIDSGDEKLLRELIISYGERVPQEKSIEFFKKWKKLYTLFKNTDIKIYGIDKVASYKFSVKFIVKKLENVVDEKNIKPLKKLLEDHTTNWSAFYKTKTRTIIEKFLNKNLNHVKQNQHKIKEYSILNHVIENIKLTFEDNDREQIMYNNYYSLQKKIDLFNNLQFFRLGIFHIMKDRINNNSTFFSKLIRYSNYTKKEIVTIQAFLNKSRVLWEVILNKKREYEKYTSKGGMGTGDHFLEHFKGIKKLKKNHISDITLFKLDSENSPYKLTKGNDTDLINVKKLLGGSPWLSDPKKSCTDYINYAILINKSKSSIPIEELIK